MNKSIVFFLLIFPVINSCAQPKPAKTKEEMVAQIDRFMQTVQDGKIKSAVLTLKQNSLISNADVDKLAITADDQMSKLGGVYGKMVAYDFVGEKSIKDFLYKRLYVLRYERFYLKFSFTIYKGSAGWAITDFAYNQDINELFK